jgi:hypothetical protein
MAKRSVSVQLSQADMRELAMAMRPAPDESEREQHKQVAVPVRAELWCRKCGFAVVPGGKHLGCEEPEHG